MIETKKVVGLRNSGLSYMGIAKKLNISKKTVSYHLSKANCHNGMRFTNNKSAIYIKLDDLKNDYINGGLSLEKIALKHNVKRATLTIVFRKCGLILRTQNEQRAILRDLGLYKSCDNKGGNNPNWHGGKSRKRYHGYTEEEYLSWRKQVFIRDNYTCVECGKRWELNAHHIIPTRIDKSKILDVNNGITICEDCHEKTYMKENQYAQRYFSLIRNTAKAGV